jgi:hypothetical protein
MHLASCVTMIALACSSLEKQQRYFEHINSFGKTLGASLREIYT